MEGGPFSGQGDQTFGLSAFRKKADNFLIVWRYKKHQNTLNKVSNGHFNTTNCPETVKIHFLDRKVTIFCPEKSIIKTSEGDPCSGEAAGLISVVPAEPCGTVGSWKRIY